MPTSSSMPGGLSWCGWVVASAPRVHIHAPAGSRRVLGHACAHASAPRGGTTGAATACGRGVGSTRGCACVALSLGLISRPPSFMPGPSGGCMACWRLHAGPHGPLGPAAAGPGPACMRACRHNQKKPCGCEWPLQGSSLRRETRAHATASRAGFIYSVERPLCRRATSVAGCACGHFGA